MQRKYGIDAVKFICCAMTQQILGVDQVAFLHWRSITNKRQILRVGVICGQRMPHPPTDWRLCYFTQRPGSRRASGAGLMVEEKSKGGYRPVNFRY